jgi:PAS domain S-box-containing protein
MTGLLSRQLDYIMLCSGLSLMVLAVTAYRLSRQKETRISWNWLAAFGVLNGISTFLEIFTLSIGDNNIFKLGRVLFAASSFLCLIEFGRKGYSEFYSKKTSDWILAALVFLGMLGGFYGIVGLALSVYYVLGLTGGLWAGWVFWRESKLVKSKGHFLFYTSIFMILYSLFTPILMSGTSFFPSLLVHEAQPMVFLAIYIRILSCLFLFAVSVLLWMNYLNFNRRLVFIGKLGGSHWTAIAMVSTLAVGWIATEWVGYQRKSFEEEKLYDLASVSAAAINPEHVNTLTGSKDEIETQNFKTVRKQLVDMCGSVRNLKIREIYLLKMNQGEIYFAAESLSGDAPAYFPPTGERYDDTPPSIMKVFKKGAPLVTGIYTDKWGTFVSGFAPIRYGGAVIGVVGIDIDFSNWARGILLARLLPIIITLLTCFLILSVFLDRQRNVETNIMLHKSEIKFHSLFENMGEGVALHQLIHDEKGNPVNYTLLDVNNQFLSIMKLRKEDVINRLATDIYGAGKAPFLEEYSKVVKTGTPYHFDTYYPPMGKYFDISVAPWGEGGFATIFTDITEHKKAYENIFDLAREWQVTFDAVSDAVWLLDKNNRIVRCNRATLDFTGKDRSEIVGKLCWEVIHGRKEAILDCPVIRMKRSKQKESQELKIDDKWFMVRVDPIFDEKGGISGAVHIISNITEKKQSEEERHKLELHLHQVQKIESIGRLTGGIAHDFNNLLTPILGYTEILSMDEELGADRLDMVEMIKKAANRAKDLTRQLLAFGRKQVLNLKTVDLGTVIHDFEKLLRRTIRENVNIRIVVPESIGSVKADVGQIEQIILNLAINAQDAMPGGGNLVISLQNEEIDEAYKLKRQEVRLGSYVMLSVSDTGAGMDKETQSHIFEPFFTTKDVGKGTGLGLSMVYGIVKQHSGFIYVYSEIGVGTEFKIYFPREDGQAEKAEYKTAVRQMSENTGETILVVEDNEMVKNITKQLLVNEGYNVIVFEKGQECIDYVKSTKKHIDLLVTDIIMPDMNGRDLYENLSYLIPELKVLYISGYDSNIIAHQGILEGGVHFLQKPFTAEALATKVRNAIEF